ncbi:MAG TPA: CAP domain-containing protein [Patescibacteria group bacterium]|nr:CAP domain-containing protein [Patescibacteria group bacterium]
MNLLEWARHFFIPHQSNNHKAKILQPSVLTVIVAVFLVYQFTINFYVFLLPSVLGYASNITPEQVVELTNQKRLESGLAPLTINSQLNEAAQRKAGDMFAFNYWAHNSPSGRTPWVFFQEVGYKYLYAGENLARDFMNSSSVVEAWMNSPTHRDNLLNGNYKEIGLAVVNGTLEGVETTLVVQMFGTPASAYVAQQSRTTPATVSTPEKTPELGEASTVEEKKIEEEKIVLAPAALAQEKEGSAASPITSPFALTKTLAVLILGIVLGALILDVILVSQKRIVRLSGKNLAHLIFITFLLLAVVLTSQGAIL